MLYVLYERKPRSSPATIQLKGPHLQPSSTMKVSLVLGLCTWDNNEALMPSLLIPLYPVGVTGRVSNGHHGTIHPQCHLNSIPQWLHYRTKQRGIVWFWRNKNELVFLLLMCNGECHVHQHMISLAKLELHSHGSPSDQPLICPACNCFIADH